MGLVSQLDRIDKSVSAVLHKAESKIIAFALLPSGTLHNNNYGVVILMFLLANFIVHQNATLENRNVKNGEAVALCIAYFITCGTMLITTKTLKKKFARDRPAAPVKGDKNLRVVNLRQREHNHSFPSGDTAQGANWICFIALYAPAFF